MGHLSSCRSLGAAVLLGAVGLIGSTVVMSAPAGADPRVPDDVWVQCTGFTSGPGFAFPHPLTGCTSRSGSGSGRTDNSSGTEILYWDKPFEGGRSLAPANIQSGPPPNDGSTCPTGQPRMGLSAEIAPNQPWAGSPVTATICVNTSTGVFNLATAATGGPTLFVIHKVPGSPGDVNPPS